MKMLTLLVVVGFGVVVFGGDGGGDGGGGGDFSYLYSFVRFSQLLVNPAS